MKHFLTIKQPLGRLCNVQFQYASAMGIARKNNLEFGLCAEKVAGIPESSPLISTRNYTERRFEYDEVVLNPNQHWNIHNSYLQSYRYFDFCWSEIKHFFSRPAITAEAQAYIAERAEGRIPVCIHVRRGDYLTLPQYHPFVGLEYYEQAMAQFDENEHHFFVTTDDFIWASENLRPKYKTVTGRDDLFDLHLGANCKHNIIANSSFGWMQGWSNENPDKKVIAPKRWFGEAYANKTTRDLIPENWIQI